jgi:hypothetical protein
MNDLWFILRRSQYLYCIAAYSNTTNEFGSNRGLIEEIFRHLSGWTEGKPPKPRDPANFRTEYHQNTRLARYS